MKKKNVLRGRSNNVEVADNLDKSNWCKGATKPS